MKKCLVCGRKIVSKRKDAIYCRNPRCRKKAFLARKEQAANAPLPIGPNKASVVVAFPDGSRWLMELTPLQATEKAQLPTLTQVSSPVDSMGLDALPQPESEVKSQASTSENGSEQIAVAVSDGAEDVGMNETGAGVSTSGDALIVSENGSESVPHVVADEVSASEPSAVSEPEAAETHSQAPPADVVATVAAVATPSVIAPESTDPGLRTVELFFVDYHGRRMAFEAATMYRGMTWRIALGARAQLGFSSGEGVGLGGTPGRWREFCPHKAPSDCGFVDNVGVLCWEDAERRAYAAEAGLLYAALGTDWRERLRQTAALRLGDG